MASRRNLLPVGRRPVVAALAIMPAAMFATISATTSAIHASTLKVIELSILNRTVTGPQVTSAGRSPGVVRVTQGETIEIVWSSEEAATLHLHGYHVETRVEPGHKVTMRFLARAAGRFPIETHGIGAEPKRHITLVYVEVHPR